jgi:hypothetical protein
MQNQEVDLFILDAHELTVSPFPRAMQSHKGDNRKIGEDQNFLEVPM